MEEGKGRSGRMARRAPHLFPPQTGRESHFPTRTLKTARFRAHRSMLCCSMLRTFSRQVGCFEHIVLFTVTNADRPREGGWRPTDGHPNKPPPNHPPRKGGRDGKRQIGELGHQPEPLYQISEVFGDTTSNATPVKVYLSAGTNQFRVVVSPKIKLARVLMSSNDEEGSFFLCRSVTRGKGSVRRLEEKYPPRTTLATPPLIPG
jgi:hypothetical protein